MRVCLDTNVLVAAFATRGLCSDVLRAVLTEHELVLGEVILAEFRRVLGHADVLVTGDDDLLAVAKDAPVPILTPRAFWQFLRGGTTG